MVARPFKHPTSAVLGLGSQHRCNTAPSAHVPTLTAEIMSTFASPARRGDFLYSSVLYADPGNSNHHPRASVAELAAFLRPEAPNLYSKGRKPETSSPAKDPPWHFYSAQLIHYGLPVTKDKNTAKVRLLNAMNQFKLEVPAWVLKVEAELKTEWEAENRKMKKNAGAGTKIGDPASSGKGKAKAAKAVNDGVNVTGESHRSGLVQIAENMRSEPFAIFWPFFLRCLWSSTDEQEHFV